MKSHTCLPVHGGADLAFSAGSQLRESQANAAAQALLLNWHRPRTGQLCLPAVGNMLGDGWRGAEVPWGGLCAQGAPGLSQGIVCRPVGGQAPFNMLARLHCRHPRDLGGSSQAFPMAASTCHPESTEPLTQVCQVRGVPVAQGEGSCLLTCMGMDAVPQPPQRAGVGGSPAQELVRAPPSSRGSFVPPCLCLPPSSLLV